MKVCHRGCREAICHHRNKAAPARPNVEGRCPMEFESVITPVISALLFLAVSMVITFLMRQIHRYLVFVLPSAMTLVAGGLVYTVFSGEAGFGVIILAGFMGIALMGALIAWAVALVSFFRHR